MVRLFRPIAGIYFVSSTSRKKNGQTPACYIILFIIIVKIYYSIPNYLTDYFLLMMKDSFHSHLATIIRRKQ